MPVSPLKKGTELYLHREHFDEDEEVFRFEIIKNAGSGTFSNTYIATDAMFGDICVIKEFAFAELCSRDTITGTITPFKSGDPHKDEKNRVLVNKWQDRFVLEAQNLIKINHTNVISVRFIWRERGTAFYAMNYIDGGTLLGPNQEGWKPKTWSEIESFAFKLLDALEAVHEVELIHGDVKTENILLTSKGDPVLVDFGTARNLAEFQATLSANTHAYTPGFAPPELHGVSQTKDVGPWSDLYSWAIVIISCLARHPKTNDGGPMSIVARYRNFKTDPYSDLASWLPNVPSNIVTVLQACVKLDHTERPKNVAETRKLFASKPMILNSENPILKNKIAELEKALQKEKKKTSKVLEKQTDLLIVGGPNGYKTINEALQIASDQTTIQVKSGTYRESLIINKNVTILGVGRVIIIGSEKSAISSTAKHAHLENLTLKQEGSENPCVSISSGSLHIEICNISGGNNCVIIDGAQTTPILEDNYIHGGKENGISVTSGADPIVRNNKIHDNKENGIVISESKVTIEKNEIYNNEYGMNIFLKSDPIIRDNKIYSNEYGILISDSKGTIEKNEIYSNKKDGVHIQQKSDPIVRKNKIHDNEQNGIVISESKGTIEQNEVYGHKIDGIAVISDSDSIISNNKIYVNEQDGIFIKNSNGLIKQNESFQNRYGIHIFSGVDPIVRNNKIYSNEYGIVISNSKGTIEKNDIYSNKKDGIFITSKSDPIVRDNKIHDNKEDGVYIFESKGTIEKNDIYSNKKDGILIFPKSDPIVRNNKIYDNKRIGIYLHNYTKGKIEYNESFNHEKYGILIASSSTAILKQNNTHDNGIRNVKKQDWLDSLFS